jgi:Kelch motif
MLVRDMLMAASSRRALAIVSLLATSAMVSWSGCGGSTGASRDAGTETGGGSDSSGIPPPQAATACLLLGGVSNAASLWNGMTWTAAPGMPPQPGLGPNIGSLNGSLVVSGGYNEVGGTWIWNGTQWKNPVNDAMSPSPYRESSALATLNDKVLLFGGCESCGGNFGLMDDTWVWDGQSWTQLHPAQSPPARFGAVAGTVAGKIVLFGGESGDASTFNDTWEWDGENWSMASPSTSPSARVAAGAAVANGKLLMFGGAADKTLQPLGDTWEWDGTNWTQLTPANSPSARWDAQMGSLRNTPVLFGGADAQDNVLGDTWTWSGTTWVSVPGATATADSSGSMGCY